MVRKDKKFLIFMNFLITF